MKRCFFIVFVAFALFSCRTTNVFQNIDHMPLSSMDSLVRFSDSCEYRLRVNDKINVSVDQHPDLSIGSIFEVYNSDEVYGKWVLIDVEGAATLPKLGKVILAGLTIREAEQAIRDHLSVYIKNPVVVVKVLNWEVSVLGEVIIPGNYNLEKMNNSILSYISKAGGFDAYAKKNEIQLIRNEGDGLKVYPIDLTDYYTYRLYQINLQPGDVIYVPSAKGKKLDQRSSTLLPFASFISALAIIVTLL